MQLFMKKTVNLLRSHSNLILFFLILAAALFFLLNRNTISYEHVASNPDSAISIPMNDGLLSQSWQADKKTIAGISLPVEVPGILRDNILRDNILRDNISGDIISGDITVFFTESRQDTEHALASSSLNVDLSGPSVLEFMFEDKLRLELGKRYYIIVTTSSDGEEASLSIPSSSRHYGCMAGTQNTDSAAALDIIYTKTSSLYWIFEILFILFSFTLAGMLVFQKRFEDVIGMTFIIMSGILYLAGIFGFLSAGVLALKILSLLLAIFCVLFIRRKRILLISHISPAFFLWGGVFVFLIFYTRNMTRIEWDEFSHWGLIVKDMFYYDSLSNHALTTNLHLRYPPFMALLQYFFEYNNGSFTEGLLYLAYQITGISLLFPMFKNITWKSWNRLIPGVIILILCPLIIFPQFLSSLYIDAMLGVITAYILLCYYSEPSNIFNKIRILLGLTALTLTKEVGLVLSCIAFFIIALDIIVKNQKLFTAKIKFPLLCAAVTFLTFISWQAYISAAPSPAPASMPDTITDPLSIASHSYDRPASPSNTAEVLISSGDETEKEQSSFAFTSVASSGIKINDMIALLQGRGPDTKYKIIQNFLKAVFTEKTFDFAFFHLTFIDALLILMLLSYLLTMKKVRVRETLPLFPSFLYLCIGGILYGMFMLLTYLFTFPDNHGLILTSYYRYMGTYLALAVLLFTSLLFLSFTSAQDAGKKETSWVYILAVIILIIAPAEQLVIKNTEKTPADALYGYDLVSENLRSFSDKTEQVYFICSTSNGFSYFTFSNAAVPMRVQRGNYHIYTEKDPEGQASVISAPDWSHTLYSSYDYVYILHGDPSFQRMYGELFHDPDEIMDGGIYKVKKHTDGTVTLFKIGETSMKGFI